MKILLSKGSITKIALLTLLLLNAFAGMTILVNAPRTKDSNVFITGSGYIELTWKSKRSEIYNSTDVADYYASLGGLAKVAIIPTHGWHINAVLIDYIPIPQEDYDEDGWIFTDVRPKETIDVTFLENGGVDDVDAVPLAEAYPDPGFGLIFVNVLEEGLAYAYTIELQEPSPIREFWDATTTAIFEPGVTVILVLNLEDVPWVEENPEALRLFKTEYYLVRSDVTWDDVVDGDDVSDVANANPSAEGDPLYNSRFDINDDGFIDNVDIDILNIYYGMSVWEDITSNVVVDEENGLVYVYGVTDGLSIFGARKKEH